MYSRALAWIVSGLWISMALSSSAWMHEALASPRKFDKEQVYAQIAAGQVLEVKRTLEAALKKEGGNLLLANDLAVLLVAEGRYEAARNVLESALLANRPASDTFRNLRELAARQYAETYAKAIGSEHIPRSVGISGSQLELAEVKKAISVALARAKESERRAELAEEQAAAQRRAQVAKAKAEAEAKERAERAAAQQLAEARAVSEAKARAERTAAEQLARSKVAIATEPSAAQRISSVRAVDGVPEAVRGQAQTSDESEKLLRAAILEWANSWARKDFARYSDFYSESFKQAKFPTKSAWIEFRRPRVLKKGEIVVEVDNIAVKVVAKNLREVRFRQRYESGQIKVRTNKKQVWAREGAAWRILSEEN